MILVFPDVPTLSSAHYPPYFPYFWLTLEQVSVRIFIIRQTSNALGRSKDQLDRFRAMRQHAGDSPFWACTRRCLSSNPNPLFSCPLPLSTHTQIRQLFLPSFPQYERARARGCARNEENGAWRCGNDREPLPSSVCLPPSFLPLISGCLTTSHFHKPCHVVLPPESLCSCVSFPSNQFSHFSSPSLPM